MSDLDKIKKIQQNTVKSGEEFRIHLNDLYESVKKEYGNISAVKKLTNKWEAIDSELILGWYSTTYDDTIKTLLFSMHVDSNKITEFIQSKTYVLPGIRTTHLVSVEDIENKSENYFLLANLIVEHIPILHITSQILVSKENDMNKRITLINMKNTIIESIKSSKKQLEESMKLLKDNPIKKSSTGEELFKKYADLGKKMQKNAEQGESAPSSAPKFDFNTISMLLQFTGIGDKMNEPLKIKITECLENGSLQHMSQMLIQYYVDKEAFETAEKLQHIIDTIVEKLRKIGPNHNVVKKLLKIATETMELMGPELESGRINPKDIFVNILEKIRSDPTGQGKKLEGPLMAICALIDNAQTNQNVDPKEATNALTNLFCAVNDCDQKQAEDTFNPMMEIIDKVKGEDGDVDIPRLLEAINDIGGMEKIKDMFIGITGANKPEHNEEQQEEHNEEHEEEFNPKIDMSDINKQLQNPQFMKDMLEDPMFRQLAQNPMLKPMLNEKYLSNMMRDPKMKKMMQNGDLSQMMNNPIVKRAMKNDEIKNMIDQTGMSALVNKTPVTINEQKIKTSGMSSKKLKQLQRRANH
jgi:hypothetical protein